MKLQLRSPGHILKRMSELDDVWTKMLAQASERARASDRHDVADYLDLKASNDLIRRTGVGWLLDTLMEHAGNANRSGISVALERTEPHNFAFRSANLVGTLLNMRYGVRCLTVEAGWTRTPADGFMRGGMLAVARFRHKGISRAAMETGLFAGAESPQWRIIDEELAGAAVHSDVLRRHVAVLIST